MRTPSQLALADEELEAAPAVTVSRQDAGKGPKGCLFRVQQNALLFPVTRIMRSYVFRTVACRYTMQVCWLPCECDSRKGASVFFPNANPPPFVFLSLKTTETYIYFTYPARNNARRSAAPVSATYRPRSN